MTATRYGIRRTSDGLWWAVENYWCRNPIAARWFPTWTAAELAALRELPDARSAWTVEPIAMVA